jgi:chemotaxis protein MotB
MARKPIHEEHENLERWLVSYADFITLLFAFFVVMYAISSINDGKYRVLSDSLVHAFKDAPSAEKVIIMGERRTELLTGGGSPIGKQAVQRPAEATEQPVTERMKSIARDVKTAMASLERQGQVRVTQSPRGITVEISASTLFASGDATLQPQSSNALASVAKVLAEIDNPIQIEGHTDNVPINSPAFPSNWELSSARAGSVVRLLVEQGVPPARLVAIGYADNKAIDSNDTPEGRSRNRRVNVLILNKVDGATELSLQN